MEKPDKRLVAGLFVAACFTLYIATAYTVFRFRHPQMTETELFLHTWDAMRFKTVTR